MVKLHLDTDIGGDMDDVCALAMLLKWDNHEITGITTNAEENGRRAGYVHYMLNLMGRTDIPVASGAEVADGYYRYDKLGYPPDEENWYAPVTPKPGALDDALILLKNSIEQGAIIVAIGMYTNLMLVDKKYPGILQHANIFLMGGYVYDIPPEYPQFLREDDFNIQTDIPAALHVLENSHPTLIPLTLTAQTALCHAHLPRLSQAGKLGQLIARQAEFYAKRELYAEKYGAVYSGIPSDIINFLHDPLACAIALGWNEGVEINTVPLKLEKREGWLYEIPDETGIPTRIVTKFDAQAFNEFWCATVCK